MTNDEKFIGISLDLAKNALLKHGEMPFGCVITRDGEIIVGAENQVKRSQDVIEHAEIVAMRKAQKNNVDLSSCTIYCSYEPCAMCSYIIRELGFSRVVFAQNSPFEGGYTKFKILQDEELCRETPNHFGPVPEIIGGVLVDRAEELWELRSELRKGVER